ncbi:hypothetical protein YC2023_022620 [Brassica napus]
MINLFCSPTKSMLSRIIWILLVIPSCVFTVDVLHQRCSGPFRCGDQKELYYPFWRSERESCGHPDFKLDCSGEFAELNISSVKYRILSMSYGSPVISLGRSDYIGHLCPADTRDAPFDQSVLQITRDNDLLTLYYDCNSFSLPATTGSNFFGELGCEDDIGDRKSYYVTRNMSSPLPNEISGLIDKAICRRDVTIPVSINALKEMEGSPSPDSLEKALKQGFELEVLVDMTKPQIASSAIVKISRIAVSAEKKVRFLL